jgi:hypothetical protein
LCSEGAFCIPDAQAWERATPFWRDGLDAADDGEKSKRRAKICG